jgi:tryptophanyl-tRNA synthetase
MRATYGHFMAHPDEVEAILKKGANKARAIATPFLHKLRHSVGLRNLAAQSSQAAAKADKVALPTFKQYREKDGLFYFKLADGSGQLMVQSTGFDQPKVCGAAIARIQAEGSAALASLGQTLQPGVNAEVVDAALAALRESKA